MNFKNIVMWHRDWNLGNLIDILDSNTNTNVRILGAEEYAIMGWDNPKNKPFFRKVSERIKKGSNTLEFVSGAFPTNKSFNPGRTKITYWKSFWPTKTVYEFSKFSHNINHADVTIPFISLNNMPWKHRCIMMDELAKNNLISKGSISWNILSADYDWKHWSQRRMIIDSQYATSTQQYATLPTDFNKSFLSLVNESTMETMFPTEKTYTPILFKKPFLVFSVKDFHKTLYNEFGFEMYDEIFDYSFDSEPDMYKRCKLIVKQVKKLVDEDLNVCYDMVAEKAQRNYNTLIQIAKNKSLVPDSILKFGGYEHLIRDMK